MRSRTTCIALAELEELRGVISELASDTFKFSDLQNVSCDLQDGPGHLFGCYGEGEGEVDVWNAVINKLWK